MIFNLVTHSPESGVKIEQIELTSHQAASEYMTTLFHVNDYAAKMTETEFKNGRWQSTVYRVVRDERNRRVFVPIFKLIKLTT